jgi:DNA-binding NarL/FixJ family response regulator
VAGVIRVALIDDQPLVRMGLSALIASEPDLELVGEAADGRAGLALLKRVRPDVALCDIRMPVLDGLGLLGEVAADSSLADIRVVVLTTFELDEYVFEALRSGASGFLLKDAEPALLLAAIRVVAGGGSLLAPSVTRRVIEEFSAGRGGRPVRPHPRLGDLTERELQDPGPGRDRPLQLRDRRRAGAQPGHGAHARQPDDGEARGARQGAAGGVRDRVGSVNGSGTHRPCR